MIVLLSVGATLALIIVERLFYTGDCFISHMRTMLHGQLFGLLLASGTVALVAGPDAVAAGIMPPALVTTVLQIAGFIHQQRARH